MQKQKQQKQDVETSSIKPYHMPSARTNTFSCFLKSLGEAPLDAMVPSTKGLGTSVLRFFGTSALRSVGTSVGTSVGKWVGVSGR